MEISTLRIERNMRLASTDWIISRHREEIEEDETTTLSSAQIKIVRQYRKALRNLPQTVDLNNVVWPELPDFLS